MYLSHFGLDEPPFRITPNTEFFFEGARRGATLEALLYAITHDEGIVKVTGEVGSGKTMLCRVLIDRLPKNVETIYLANPSLSREEILRAIAEDLRVETRGRRTTVLLRALQEHLIQRYAEGGRVVVLIDEAHAMPNESLEEIRLLSNLESNRHKLLQIVLFGQPELDEHLDLTSMRQLRERITHSFGLEPLVAADIERYVTFRMRTAGRRGPSPFAPAALRVIGAASEGLTRRINILCDKALLAAFADDAQVVGRAHARAAVQDTGFKRLRSSRPWWLVAAGIAVGLGIGAGARFAFPLLSPLFERTMSSEAQPDPLRSSIPLDPRDDALPILETPPADQTPATTEPPAQGDDPSASAVAPAAAGPAAATDVANAAAGNAEPNDRTAPAEVVPMTAAVVASVPAEGIEARWRGASEIAGARFAAAQQWLRTTPDSRYSIQLLTAPESDLAWVERFLQQATTLVNPEELYVFSTKVNGRTTYRLTYGTFDNVAESLAAIAQLPQPLRTYQPYPETVATMRQQGAQQ